MRGCRVLQRVRTLFPIPLPQPVAGSTGSSGTGAGAPAGAGAGGGVAKPRLPSRPPAADGTPRDTGAVGGAVGIGLDGSSGSGGGGGGGGIGDSGSNRTWRARMFVTPFPATAATFTPSPTTAWPVVSAVAASSLPSSTTSAARADSGVEASKASAEPSEELAADAVDPTTAKVESMMYHRSMRRRLLALGAAGALLTYFAVQWWHPQHTSSAAMKLIATAHAHPASSSSSSSSSSSKGSKEKESGPEAQAKALARGRERQISGSALAPGEVAGDPMKPKQKVLDMGADLMQKFAPLRGIHLHLCGFHFYNGAMHRQVEAHHFCSHLTGDVHQCLIYDSEKSDARLIGIEYVISEKLFASLPEEEKKYWHSHRYEISSGILVAPRIPVTVEKQVMQELANTYGKTIHTWQIDRGDVLPLGPPMLMMSFTQDGQLDPALVQERDEAHGLLQRTPARFHSRRDLEYHPVLDGADHWEHEPPWQIKMQRIRGSKRSSSPSSSGSSDADSDDADLGAGISGGAGAGAGSKKSNGEVQPEPSAKLGPPVKVKH